MYQGNTPSTGDTLTFTAGTLEALTCTPSLCRPEATIDWYIGNNFKQSSTGTTYSLNASNADHNEPIYCIGYNDVTSASERPVSNKPVLYVRGKNHFYSITYSPNIVNADHNEQIYLYRIQ